MTEEQKEIIQDSSGLMKEGQAQSSDSWAMWLLKAFVFPLWNIDFYRQSTRRKLGIGILFIFVFAILQTGVTSYRTNTAMKLVDDQLSEAYANGDLPTIMIKDGIAIVDGRQPLAFYENRQFIGIDTTGVITEIDTQAYSEGFLLTRTELHIVSDEGYQVMALQDLNASFGNPIVIDEDQALTWWGTFKLIANLAVLFGVYFWNTIVKLIYILLMGLVVWGVVSLFKKNVSYEFILMSGILVNVPTVYVMFILKQFEIKFFLLHTMVFVLGMGIVLYSMFNAMKREAAVIE